MSMRLKAVGNKILIKIDKKKQLAKAKLGGLIIVPPAYEYMMYKLQYAEILDVGEGVTDPDIRVGRTAIIHHIVESQDQNLLKVLPNGDEVRVCRVKSDISSYQLYGVFSEEVDEEGHQKIIPFGQFIFCKPEVKPDVVTETIVDEVSKERVTYNAKKVGSLYIPEIPKDEEGLQCLTEVVAVSKEEQLIKPGDMIISDSFSKYPIEVMGRTFWIMQREFVLTVLKSKEDGI